MIGAASGCVTAALLGVQCYAGWGGLIVLPVVWVKAGSSSACWWGHRQRRLRHRA
jgi:fructose-specific PTS system IIC-like component